MTRVAPVGALILAGLLVLPGAARAAGALPPDAAWSQSTPPPPPPTPPPPPPTPPPDQDTTAGKPGAEPRQPLLSDAELERIRKQLEKPPDLQPKIQLNDDRLRFYISVVAKQPRLEDIIGSYDLKVGPTKRGNPMTHQEFLNMVTPKELYGSGGIQAIEMLQFAVVNYFAQAIIKRGLEEMREAKTERELQEIRARIERELAALRGTTGGKPGGGG